MFVEIILRKDLSNIYLSKSLVSCNSSFPYHNKKNNISFVFFTLPMTILE